MAFTFNKRPEGTIEVFQDGKRISTTTAENARKSYGYTGDLTLPDTSQPISDLTLPQDTENNPTNNLLTFKDTISKVTDLARNKRNETSLEFMSQFRGTTAASDFNQILGNLNRASEQFTTEATERLLPEVETEVGGGGDDISTPSTNLFTADTSTAKDLKTQLKDKFQPTFANKIILELNDEQMREFMRDYDATANKLQMNVDPEMFFEEWKGVVGVGQSNREI